MALEGRTREELAADPSSDVSAELRRIEDLRRAVRRLPKSRLPIFVWSFGVASLCVILIAIGINWRVTAIGLSFVTEAQAVEVRASTSMLLEEPLRITRHLGIIGALEADFRGAQPQIGRLENPGPLRIEVLPTSPPLAGIADQAVPAVADTMELSFPSIPEGSVLRIACLSDGIVEFTITGEQMVAEVSTSTRTRIIGQAVQAQAAEDRLVDPGGSFRLISEQGNPLTFRVTTEDAASILAGHISTISFPTDLAATPNLRRFRSAVEKGTLTVHTVDQKYEMDRFDELRLGGVDGSVVIQTGVGECLEVSYEGSAQTATLGKGASG